MGCWNGTDALTKLPILAGEPVYIFPLVQSYGTQIGEFSLCYHTAFWTPLPLFFNGKYDDYGAASECQGASIPIIIDSIKENLVELEIGENESHDIAIEREEFDLDLFFEGCKENSLFINNHLGFYGPECAKSLIQFVMIKDHVMASILDDYKYNTTIYGNDEVIKLEMTYSKLLDDGIAYINEMSGLINTHDNMMSDIIWYSFGERRSQNILGQTINSGRIFCTYFSMFEQENRTFMRVKDLLLDAIKNDYVYIRDHIIAQLCVSAWLSSFMDSNRNMWCLPSGAGSQDYDTHAHEFLAKVTLHGADLIQNYYNEDYCDEDYDD